MATAAISAASAMRRIAASGEVDERDRAILTRARDMMLQVARSARIQVATEGGGRATALGSVAQARLALQALDPGAELSADIQLMRLLTGLDSLLAGGIPDEYDEILAYFERLADASLRSNSSTGEVLIGGGRH